MMEAFASLPTPHQNSNNNEHDHFLSLSQFDIELQQQAQLAMEQELAVWEDFENYLPPIAYDNNEPYASSLQIKQVPDIKHQSIMDGQFVDLVENTGLNMDDLQQLGPNSLTPQQTQQTWSTITTSASTSLPTENKVEFSEPIFKSPVSETFHSSSSIFGSPNSSLHASDSHLTPPQTLHQQFFHPQQLSPVSMGNTPLETPIHSPKHEMFAAPIYFHSFPNTQMQPTLPVEDVTNTGLSPQAETVMVPQRKKTTHNAIERRYRNNINDRIAELKNAVPALLHAKVKDTRTGNKRRSNNDEDDNINEDGKEYLDGVAVATKLNKATILRKATEYIHHLKKTGEDLKRDNATLQYILAQLPGGQEVLERYRMQQSQREQEMQRKNVQEHVLQKKRGHQQQSTGSRKRSRLPQSPEKEYESCSSDPLTSPVSIQQFQQKYLRQKLIQKQCQLQQQSGTTTISNRVFMTVFMAISFFSTSPLSAGPTSKDQFESHGHISRTADDMSINNSSATNSFLGSFFPLADGWSIIRSTIFAICLIQLFFPLFRFYLFSFKIKRVNKKIRTTSAENKSSLDGNIASHVTSLTPGDQKCMQIYSILVKSLESDHANKHRKTSVFPHKYKSAFGFYIALGKEVVRFVSRHWLGYEILYDDQDVTPQEQWVQACKWIKLNEVECLGGNPDVTRASMLYSCFHMLNLIELMEDDENEFVEQSRSRVYATTAMQMALVVPHNGLAEKLSRYFWRLAMYESGLEDDPLMRALIFDCHEDDGEDRMEVMLASRAWQETLEVMNQQIEYFGKGANTRSGLSLSMTAPVLVPVGILSTLHLLDNLQTQFGRLIISVTAKPLTETEGVSESDIYGETAFCQLMDMTVEDSDNRFGDYHRLAHWLASVGTTVDALWKSDTKTAERLLHTLVEKVPRSLVSRESTDSDVVHHKERMNQLDELTKKSMVHILIGSTLLKKGDIDALRGVEELWKAEQIRKQIKKVLNNSSSKRSHYYHQRKFEHEQDLESSVLALAEFVTAITGLEAWISAWRLAPSLAGSAGKDRDVWENTMTEQVRHSSLYLRRMIYRHSLDGLRTNKAIIDRLTRLCSYVSSQVDENDSACECSDFDEQEDNVGSNNNEKDLLYRRSEKALEILRGLS